MKLKKLFKDISNLEIKGSREVEIKGICANSKLVGPDFLFIARKGKTFDGGSYIREAIQGGASVILTDLFDPSLRGVVQVMHSQISTIEGILAATYYQHPSKELLMVGITGTNGKTTISIIAKNLLEHMFNSCGLIGTIEYVIGNQRYPANRTTPDVISNHQLLREMVNQQCGAGIMEVSSHALDQGRVHLIDFDVAVFSNLSLDHLDYHGTMEKYGEAKRRLFRHIGNKGSDKKNPKWAIVNQDSPWTPFILEGCKANILTYGIENPADLQATSIHLEAKGTHAKVAYRGKIVDCYWPLVGRFNVYNCLAAMGVALSQEIPLELVASYMSQISSARGRLQQVKNCLGLNIYVDFAHSDDALTNVLASLREIQKVKGKLIVVFGCGGDRDRFKRPKMAEVCEYYADFSIVTSDNPRSEDPSLICEEIIKGFAKKDAYVIELDRRFAIQKAIEMASIEDIILIAGKGHETNQVIGHQILEFDDCKIAKDICAQLQLKRKECFG